MNLNIFKSIIYAIMSLFGIIIFSPLSVIFFAESESFIIAFTILLILSLIFYSHYESKDKLAELNNKIDKLNKELTELKINNK